MIGKTFSHYRVVEKPSRQLGQWAGHAPDDSILALRDTSLDETFALELDTR
jgi:hypothetical protein